MQEEVTQKTIALVIKSAKTGRQYPKSCDENVSESSQKAGTEEAWKVSVKELGGEGLVRPRLKLRTATLNLLNGQPVNTMLILP